MPQARRAAFSLVELMIALGVLAIGIAMVAGLFPAAIKQTESSYNDAVGTIIAQNGLALAKATLAMGDIPEPPGPPPYPHPLAVVVDDSKTFNPPIDPILREYHDDPAAPTFSDKGFLVLGRKTGDHEAQLVIVAYAKKNPSANGKAVRVTLSSAISASKASINTIPGGLKGSPLILEASGAYAIIEKVEGMDLYLDHVGLNALPGTGNGDKVWVVVEAGQNGVSPAMAVVTATVALPQ